MGSADYFYKIDDAKSAIILEAKQELDKVHIKKLSLHSNEALFTAEQLDTKIDTIDAYQIEHKRIKRYLRKKVVDFDKYESYTDNITTILNTFVERLEKSNITANEENIKRFIIEPILKLLNFKEENASLEHPLDNEKYSNPQEQLLAYLEASEFTGYKVYGILSNGLVWKLYYKNKNGKTSKSPIVKFDISSLLDDEITKIEKNKLISCFIETFTFTNLLANEKNYRCSLMDNLLEIDDCIYAESLELSERLFKNIADKGYIELAKGIATASKQQNINLSPKQLEQYSMKILFRLIFVLYSESRGFLPLNQTTYYNRYSLEKIVIELGKNKEKHIKIEDDLWARINDLFRAIDNGKMGGHIKVPVYNGGLFREFKDDILNKIFIDNKYIEVVLLSLVYHEKKVTFDRIDYNLLDVKYIGTIYERLLDYKIVEENNNYRLIQKGENNTRKGLGAYYTPDNVTKYIIKNALDKKIDLFKKEFDKQFKTLPISETYKLQDYCIYKKLFELKIIDISCGSGHFLIDTIEYLADVCMELKDFYLDYNNFQSNKLKEIEYQQKEINKNDEFIESSLQKATFKDVCKRYILKHCIYGMDINPLATDITKFAIWLETFIVGIPLSFMDNHIKYGNSVLGFIDNIYTKINIDKLASGKSNLFFNDMINILEEKREESVMLIDEVYTLIAEINSNIDISTQEVETNYASYAKVDARLQYLKFIMLPLSFLYYILQDNTILKTINSKTNKLILDKILETLIEALNYTKWDEFVETYFIFFRKQDELDKQLNKHKLKKDFFDEMLEFVASKRKQTANKLSKILDNVFDFEFTNWFLEFPNIKFDVVLGNPPYVRADTDGNFARQREVILNAFDYETLYEKWDLMMAFVERSYKLLKYDGIMSLIIKDDYLKAKYASKSREYFSQNAKINRIDFLSDIQVFSGVGVKNIILEYQKSDILEHKPLRLKHCEEFGNTEELSTENQSVLMTSTFEEFKKSSIEIDKNMIKLGDILYISIGMVLNANEKIAKGEFKKDDLISLAQDAVHTKQYIEGENVKPFEITSRRYLEWGTRRCPALIRRATFTELHETRKIITNKIGELSCTYDDTQIYCDQTVRIGILWKNLKDINNKSITMSIEKDYNIKGKILIREKRKELEELSILFLEKYLVALLNSSCIKEIFNQIRQNSYDINPSYLKTIPIKIISIDEQQKFVDIADEIMNKKSNTLKEDTKDIEETLDNMVSKLYET